MVAVVVAVVVAVAVVVVVAVGVVAVVVDVVLNVRRFFRKKNSVNKRNHTFGSDDSLNGVSLIAKNSTKL